MIAESPFPAATRTLSLASVLLFILVYALHANSPVIQSIDSIWTIHTAQSLLSEGNLDLDEYKERIKSTGHYGVRKRHGHLYNYFPYGTALLSTPFVGLFNVAPNTLKHLIPGASAACKKAELTSRPCTALTVRLPLERAIASLFTALTTVLIFFIANHCISFQRALLAALCFAFGTSAWSTASRGLWQHAPSMLLLSLALLLIIRAENRKQSLSWCGIPLALSYIVRPTNGPIILAFAIFIALRYRSECWRFMSGVACTLLPFVVYNYIVFNHAFPSYYRSSRLEFAPHFFEAVAASFVSPSRGVLVLSPFLLCALPRLPSMLRSLPIAQLCFVCVCLQASIVGLFDRWWGGHCFGARLMSDVTPFLMVLALPFFALLGGNARRFHRIASVLALLAIVVSVLIHYRGANVHETFLWNAHPVDIDSMPSRVWSLSDPQFLRGGLF